MISGAGALLLLVAVIACQPSPALERSAATAPPLTELPTPAARPVPFFSHIFVIVMENREYSAVIGSPDAPYSNQLASTFGLATRYYAIRHPSLPNYLALISGSIQGITNDCGSCSVNGPNLVDQLDAHHLSWGAYMEDLPSPCFNGTDAGGPLVLIGRDGYVRRHDPFLYFADIRTNPGRCRRVVPLSQLDAALQGGQVPDFVWITPNLQHDMHNSSTRDGDRWLASFVPKILASSAWRNGGVLFVTWDEGTTNDGCCGVSGGRVPLLVVAASGKRGVRSAIPHTHYSLLRTIEDAWQLGYLGHAGDPNTSSLREFFR